MLTVALLKGYGDSCIVAEVPLAVVARGPLTSEARTSKRLDVQSAVEASNLFAAIQIGLANFTSALACTVHESERTITWDFPPRTRSSDEVQSFECQPLCVGRTLRQDVSDYFISRAQGALTNFLQKVLVSCRRRKVPC